MAQSPPPRQSPPAKSINTSTPAPGPPRTRNRAPTRVACSALSAGATTLGGNAYYDVLHSRPLPKSGYRPGRSGGSRSGVIVTLLRAACHRDVFSFEDRLRGYKSAAGSKLNLNTRGVVEDPKTPCALARTEPKRSSMSRVRRLALRLQLPPCIWARPTDKHREDRVQGPIGIEAWRPASRFLVAATCTLRNVL